MTVSKIAIDRLYTQRLEDSNFEQPAQVVSWLGAVQAQDYGGAKWALGQRLPGSHEAEIEHALADKAILRTWAIRGTLHFVAPQDIHWLLGLVGPRLIRGNTRRYGELELDEATLRRSNDLLAEAVQGGQERTRRELFAMLNKQGISTQGQRGVYMLQRASLDRLVGQARAERNNPTFISLAELSLETTPISREEAVARLARRYFTSHGPASLQDFAWWSGLPAAEARTGLEAARAELRMETVEGQDYWRPAQAQDRPPLPAPRAYLLPAYDEYMVGYTDRRAALDAQTSAAVSSANGLLSTLALDGRIVGTWRKTVKKDRLTIAFRLFARLDRDQKEAVTATAEAYAGFLGLSLEALQLDMPG